MSEPNTNAIPSVRQRTQVKTLTSLAMLTAIAYVMMYLSKLLPQVSGFLQLDVRISSSVLAALCSGLWPPPSSPSWWLW